MNRLSFLPRPRFGALPLAALLLGQRLTAQSGPPLAIEVSGSNQVQITWPPGTNFNVLEEALGLDGTNLWQDVPDAPSPLGALYSVHTAITNGSTFYRLVQRGAPGVTTPPDPASVAPALSPNVFNAFGPSTAFLYTGPNPIQIGVAPGTIQAIRAAVLRGTVRRRDGTTLSGVRVALLNHPEFGYTFTRTNGMFDLAVNAAQYTVDFQAIGYCPAQRQAQVSGQNFLTLPDVVMIGMDPMATPVMLGSSAPAQMAASSPQTDESGTRAAMVFIPAGTAAAMVMPDGSTQAVSALTFRVTEFTVGSNGPAAMPASLPPNSGYTYCAEFTGDEAVAAGAKTVQFSQPLPVYVDNYLGIPVGTLVPIGSYDRDQGVWMPSSNGIVLQVLGSTNGAALIDLHGTGRPETAATLAANGFTAGELQNLATLYPAGKTLWRSPVPHFSSWDFNYGAFGPDPNKPNKPGDKPKGSPNDDSPDDYGTLNFSTQTFAEEIPLVGVPFDLHYNSARVPDYRVNNELTIPVAWQKPLPPPCDAPNGAVCIQFPSIYDKPPAAILVETEVNGEQSSQTLPGTNKVAVVSWDGRDAYGRLVGGTRQAHVNVAYEYPNGSYFGVSGGPEFQQAFPALFGNDGNLTSFAGHMGTTVGIGAVFQQLMTYPDHRDLGFGGWSPTVLHRWDPVGGILYYGDGHIGTVAQASILGSFQSQLAGNPARVVAAAPDGSIYFDGPLTSGDSQNFIFRRLPGGTFQIVTVPTYAPGAVYPNGVDWSKVDGRPVDKVSVGSVDLAAMCVGPDGSVYVTDSFVIARLTPDGIWHVIAGLNAAFPPIYQPDGTPATNSYATQGGRVTMAVGPDSSVYFTGAWGPINGTNYSPIRKIAPDGRLYTVYGATGAAENGVGNQRWETTMGTSAFAAQGTGNIEAIAVAKDGTIYVSPGELFDGGAMFKISPAGVILPFLSLGPVTGAGAGYNPNDTNNTARIQGDEGRLATQVQLTSGSTPSLTLAIGPDGSVYFTCDTVIVWRVNPNGILERVAGRYGSPAYNPPNLPGDGGDPLGTELNPVEALAVTPDNTLVLVRASTTPYIMLYPDRSAQRGVLETPVETQNIPSEDGSEVYVFAQDGRHLSTLDGLTGAVKWSFGYDTNSLVVTMTDLAGNVTRVERDGAGRATAIVGPYGQRTTLGLDVNGFLSTVSNPANETTTLANTAGGLLSSIKGPLGEIYSVSYDKLGRVSQVSDPLGGGWTDTVTDVGVRFDYSYLIEVACTNSLGDSLLRQMILQPEGGTDITYFDGTNATSATTQDLSGDEYFNFLDGSSLSFAVGADPRFGSQVKQETASSLWLPGNLVYSVSIQHTAGLTNSADPFSLTGLTNVTTINGQSYASIYNATNLTTITTSPVGRTSKTVLDSLGRLSLHQDPGAFVVGLGYDAQGRMISSTNILSTGLRQTTVTYDSAGQMVKFTDALGEFTSFTYDAAGRLSSLTLSDGATAGYAHDSEYHLTSVTPPGRPAHTFQYNAVGSLTKYTPPLVGSDESVGYQYDTERNLTQVSFPDGQVMSFQRGPAGRIDAVTLGSGPGLTYQYGSTSGPGNLLVTNVSSTTGDALQLGYTGSLLTSLGWSGTITGSVVVQLNADLLPLSKSVNSNAITYAYDADRLLTQAGNMSLTRDPARGGISATALGTVTDQRQFDERGLLTNYVASVNGTAIWSFGLSYDLVDRLTNKVESINGVTNRFGYLYDAGGRLQQVWQNGALATTYSYDSNGNRLSRNAEGAVYDAQDRVTSYNGATFDWSPNGGLQSRASGAQTTSYSYDVRGALTSVGLPGGTQVSYLIDANGHRIGKSIGGALQRGWLWDGLVPVAEVDANSAVSARFVYGEGTTPTFLLKGAGTYRILSDERGSVRLVVNVADGAIAQQLDYDEFGRVLADTAPGFQPFGFAGGLYDPDTGLVRFGLRDYSSETGQWTARDPFTFAGGGYSLYSYVHNDPLNWNDPTGAGPFGLKTRNGAINRVYGELFHNGQPKGGNDGQLQQALDGADQQLKGALKTGGQLTAGGAVVYVAGSTLLLAATVTPLAATATAGSSITTAAPATTAAGTVAAADAGATTAATAAPAVAAAPAAAASTATAATSTAAAAPQLSGWGNTTTYIVNQVWNAARMALPLY